MQYRVDKVSGHRLSVLGFGCMRFPKNFGITDLRRSEELVMAAIEGGINYFDTAWMYPGNEDALGKILEKNGVRDKVFIATKLPLALVREGRDFEKFFRQSLERLRTGHVDYYLLHMLTDMDMWNTLKSLGIEAWIDEKKKSGQIGRIGFSFHGSGDQFLRLVDDYPWEFCQIQYNYSDENFQAGVTGLRRAAAKMPVMIMEPLLGGKLVSLLPREAAELFKRADPAVSPAGWGLNWVWNQEEVTLLLSGMSSGEQLEENLRLADASRPGMLDGGDLAVYREVLALINRAFRVRCTGCGYCMPCPRGVNIPGCFGAYNASFAIGWVEGMKQFTTSTAVTSARRSGPGLCVECGKCEERCPQHIPIITSLKSVGRRMEPLWYRGAMAVFRRVTGGGRA
ncbi:MAG: aldo/keto reductase [Treponema sp.]|jgi:predicted aldo/keto reductase-like oxidoreductase|nr:aldo/keto reductase [Treponema sp.]